MTRTFINATTYVNIDHHDSYCNRSTEHVSFTLLTIMNE